MAANVVQLSIQVRFPFWMKPYIYALHMLQDVGLLDVDQDVAREFIVAHTRWRIAPGGEWQHFKDSTGAPPSGPRKFILG